MIRAINQDKSKPDVVDFLRNILIKYKILEKYGKIKKFKIRDREAFMKIFKAFFIIWLYNNFNLRSQSNFCFVKLNKNHTVLLLPPTKTITAYLNENNTSFFKNSILEGIELPSSVITKHCIVQNFINLNLRQFGKKEVETGHKKSCGPCFRNFSKKFVKDIVKDINIGFALGGLPFLIDGVSSLLIKELTMAFLAEASTRREINESLSSVLLAFVCVYVGDKKKFGGGRTNCAMISPQPGSIKQCSNEIDAIIYSQHKKTLIAIELTSLTSNAFRQSWEDKKDNQFTLHFKKTLNNFNFLKTYAEAANFEFKELYLTLQNFSKEMKKIPQYHILNRSPKLQHRSLQPVFQRLKRDAERDTLSAGGINNSFSQFIKIINKL